MGVAALACLVALAGSSRPSVTVAVGASRVPMGRTVAVSAVARLADGSPAAGRVLLPYVNARRRGSHEVADASGRARFLLPLPRPGAADIRVALHPAPAKPSEQWIWSSTQADSQTVFLQGVFRLPTRATDFTLWAAVDDRASIYLNGERIAEAAGWTRSCVVRPPARLLRAGDNVISVEAYNHSGPAGLLIRCAWQANGASGALVSGSGWLAFDAKPQGWPARASSGSGRPASVVCRADEGVWGPMLTDWPTVVPKSRLMCGSLLDPALPVSEPVRVEVVRRAISRPPADPQQLVGIQWEPWFTPSNANWSTAQAVPLLGFYWSWDPDVTRQHMLWLAESGIDFLVVDWTNHLWDKTRWNDRLEATNEIIHCTTLALETCAALRDEGVPVPKTVLLLGLTNGPSTTMEAINEEMDWVYHNYVRNPRFAGLFVEYLGKPLIMVFNGGGPGWLVNAGSPYVDDSRFTIRWCGSQHQVVKFHEAGYWSWMDGSLEPTVTLLDGNPEAQTVSCAFFGYAGWLAPDAYGRRNGATLVDSFRSALKVRPRFLMIHQFQEFAGQPEGQGYGPRRDVYVDSYSPEFSDDIEPVSLTAPAYRGKGGWGFMPLNLMRALVDLYRQKQPATTVLAVGKPLRGSRISGAKMRVAWTWVGRKPSGFAVTVTGTGRSSSRPATVTSLLPASRSSVVVDVGSLRPGPVSVRVRALGTRSRYVASWTTDAVRLTRPVEASFEVPVTRSR